MYRRLTVILFLLGLGLLGSCSGGNPASDALWDQAVWNQAVWK